MNQVSKSSESISEVEAEAFGRCESTGNWSNKIKTSRYTLLNFIPLNMFYQFQNFSNVYFLSAGILETIPSISDSSGLPLILVPLAFVLAVTAAKDAIQDIKTHRADHAENRRISYRLRRGIDPDADLVLSEKVFDKVRWDKLLVGDIVKVNRGEAFPADLILLLSADPSGSAYVETKDLDGETNLKPKCCHPEVISRISWPGLLAKTKIRLVYEPPSSSLYTFDGKLYLSDFPDGGDVAVPLSADQLLLRGSTLQTTRYVYGIVVYTGKNTRLCVNSAGASSTRYKTPKLLKEYSQHVVELFVFQLIICVICAVVVDILLSTRSDWYLRAPNTGAYSSDDIALYGAKVFGVLLLQFTYFVPISVLVLLELVRIPQSWMITVDRNLQHKGTPAAVNNSSLMDELGAVSHVFSDKTGTLTENLMLFTTIWALGVATDAAICTRNPGSNNSRDSHVNRDFDSAKFIDSVNEMDPDQKYRVGDLLLTLALCHAVLQKSREEETTGTYFKHLDSASDILDSEDAFDSSSPDELALVAGARYLGIEFVGRPAVDIVSISFSTKFARSLFSLPESGDIRVNFKVLEMCEFDNDRKRMSTMIEVTEDVHGWKKGEVVLLTKGADSAILAVAKSANPRLAESQEVDMPLILEKFAAIGLRTLVFAKRVFPSITHVSPWRQTYAQARSRVGEEKKLAVKAAISEIEIDLEIIGCSGIEDKLQEGVPETISMLRSAGVKLWVLTGDKIETAINIGYSCHLLDEGVYNQIISHSDPASIDRGLDDVEAVANVRLPALGKEMEWNRAADKELAAEGFNVEGSGVGSHFIAGGNLKNAEVSVSESFTEVAITISGDALATLLRHKSLRDRFFRFALSRCTTVIACRVTPKQKADLVQYASALLRQNTILAIGDGANDVGMITAAHVGVGLCGKEGSQAVRSSDFALPQFRGLQRLLFVHGRETLRKNSTFVYFSIFKNVVFAMPIFWYSTLALFSGPALYEVVIKIFYSLFFSVFASIFYGMFDRELPTSLLSRAPFLYKWSHDLFGRRVLLKWLALGLWVSVWVFYAVAYSLAPYPVGSSGFSTVTGEDVGMVTYFAVVIIVNLFFYRITNSFYFFVHLGIWAGIGSFLIAYGVGSVTLTDIYGTFTQVLLTTRGIGALILSIGGSCLPMTVYHVYMALFHPNNARIARERVYLKRETLVAPGENAEMRSMQSRRSLAAASVCKASMRGSLQPEANVLSDAALGYAFTESDNMDRINLYARLLSKTKGQL